MTKRIIIFVIGLVATYLVTILALTNIRLSDYTLFQYLTRTEVRTGWFGYSLSRFREVENYTKVDILFVGSSHCYRSFDPRVFSQAGLSTFDIGSDAQSPLNSHYLLRRYGDLLSPRLVIFEVNPTIFRLDGLESFYDLLANSEVSSEIVQMGLAVGKLQTINALFARVLTITEGPFSELNQKEINNESYVAGGHVSSHGVNRHDLVDEPHEIVIREEQIDFFKQNIELVRLGGAEILLVIAPVPAERLALITNYEQITAEINTIAQEFSIQFHDMNREMLFSTHSHFRDSRHLNSRGAKIFSEAILDMLRTTSKYSTALNLKIETAQLDANDKVISESTEQIKTGKDSTDFYLRRGVAFRNKGFHLKAMSDFNKVIALSPDNAEGHFNRGNIYFDKQQLNEAIADFSRTIEIDPGHYEALGNRGVALMARGDTSLGMADYDSALTLRPHLEPTLLSRGSVYLRLGQKDKAVADFETFLSCASNKYAKYFAPVQKIIRDNKGK